MRQLHTINSSAALKLCLRVLESGDGLLLIEDGVYLAVDKAMTTVPAGIDRYALTDDLAARGLAERLTAEIESVDMNRFVALCCEYDKVVNWF